MGLVQGALFEHGINSEQVGILIRGEHVVNPFRANEKKGRDVGSNDLYDNASFSWTIDHMIW